MIVTHYANNLPCKARGDDGDALLWGALIKASLSGTDLPDEQSVTAAFFSCQSADGRFWRSPLRIGVEETNSFSRDMSLAVMLGFAAEQFHVNKLSLGTSLAKITPQAWVDYVVKNKHKCCPESTDGRNVVTPPVFWHASYLGAKVPKVYQKTRALLYPYLLLAALTTKPGFTMHLVGVALLIQNLILSPKFPAAEENVIQKTLRALKEWTLTRCANILSKRMPRNAFFALLAGKREEAIIINGAARRWIEGVSQGEENQWCWEREDAEHAYRNSCGHDVLFIENIIKNSAFDSTF